MLTVKNLRTCYGKSQVLFGFSLDIPRGGAAALLGRNGMGKTTAAYSITGRLPCDGDIVFNDAPIHNLPAFQIAQRGIALVPEGRQIFPNLTVRENLMATAANYNSSQAPSQLWTLSRVLELFPQLGARIKNMGNQLSGGEQQMLATARALMLNPQLLILDEATEGLAPRTRAELRRQLSEIKNAGIALLIIDNNPDELGALADEFYLLEKGAVVWRGDGDALRAGDAKARYLGV